MELSNSLNSRTISKGDAESKACWCCADVPFPAGYEYENTAPFVEPTFNESEHLALNTEAVDKLYMSPDFGYDEDFVRRTLPSNFGCSAPFRMLTDDAMDIIDSSIRNIEKHAKSSPRIPCVLRGGTWRSKFLNDLGHSPAVLKAVSEMAGAEMIYHPMKIQNLHLNQNPKTGGKGIDEEKQTEQKQIDRFHCDTTQFVIILFCTHHESYEGGHLEYFAGSREEGYSALKAVAAEKASNDKGKGKGEGEALTSFRTKVKRVGTQQRGFGVFMQGSRILHQVSPLIGAESTERNTLVFSFQPKDVLAWECCDRAAKTYNKVDPLHVLLPDWVRFRAWKIARRMEMHREYRNNNANNAITKSTSSNAITNTGTTSTDITVVACHSTINTTTSSNSIYVDEKQEQAQTLALIVDKVCADMVTVARTLPYTEDRALLSEPMRAAIAPLRAIAHTLLLPPPPPPLLLLPGDSEKEQEKGQEKEREVSEEDRHGVCNLLAALFEADNCLTDLEEMQSAVSAMEYF